MMAGFAGNTSSMISATVVSLGRILFEYANPPFALLANCNILHCFLHLQIVTSCSGTASCALQCARSFLRRSACCCGTEQGRLLAPQWASSKLLLSSCRLQ